MKYLTQPEREALEATCIRNLGSDLRNATMILVALYTGTRRTELLNLTWADFDLNTMEVSITTLKGGVDRTVPIPTHLKPHLEVLRSRGGLMPWPIKKSRLQAVWCVYRPSRKPIHALRHTFGYGLYDKTHDVMFTMQNMGHKSANSTMVYTKKQYTSEEYRKLMGVR